MITIRRPRPTRRVFLIAFFAIAVGTTLLLLSGCGTAQIDPEDSIVGSGGVCSCDGTTLHCDAQNNQPALDQPNSEYCNAEVVKATGICSCSGSDLVCDVSVCTFSLGGCMGLGSQKHVTVCRPGSNINSQFPTEKGLSSIGGMGAIHFPDDPQCASGATPPPPPPPATPASSGGSSSGGESCACAGVDYICKNADGSIKSASYNATQCGGSGACDCRAPKSSLACPDGTYADFNPTCTGGGGSGTCGNSVCDPGEDSVNCQVDCGKP